MSDTNLGTIIQYGTQANRIAFTPNPATGSKVLYMWLETDHSPDTYAWNGSAWVKISSAGTAITSLTGDVTATGPGAAAATIANSAVSNAKLANMVQALVKGRASGAGTGAPTDLTGTQLAVIVDAMVGDSGAGGTKGEVPAPSSGDAAAGKFLKADGTWAVPPGSTSGTVTHTGSLTADQLVLGNGTADIKPFGSAGTTIQVLHGNAGGAPSFGAVVEADITLANNTTNDVSTTKHGFAPILPNDAKKFLGGTGLYSSPFAAVRTDTVASSATPTINTDTTDIFTITALAVAITSMTTNLSGTPVNGQKLIIRILDNGGARAITWGASFVSRGATLPTTTVLSKYLYVGLIWNSTATVWDCVATAQES